MPVSTSLIFEFLERLEAGTIERHEFALTAFGALRRNLRQIVSQLCISDDQDALQVSNRLRALLSEWLTVPVPFDRSMLIAVEDLLGRPAAFQARWGSDMQTFYDTALRAAEDLASIENPVREKLRTELQNLWSQGRTVKIYCHRRARPHFESLFVPLGDLPLSEDAFLHSVRDYRESGPFDVLVKVGPLRSRGWGSAPDALLTAPRFDTLLQIVWSGCSDDPDFGYDPVSLSMDVPTTEAADPVVATRIRRGPMQWSLRVTLSGEDLGAAAGYTAEVDDLRIFSTMNQPYEKRLSTLVQVDDEYGILYPLHFRVLSFAPEALHEPIALRIPGETLTEGMFLITPLVDEVDLGGMRAEHGHYGRVWREELERQWRNDGEGLIRRLHDAGLELVHLNAAIRNWCRPPGTVIHAPQQMKYFEILLRVLGCEGERNNGPRQQRAPLFWQLAWNEVRRSRGEAIQTGVQGQELVEEQQRRILTMLMPQIREKALAGEGFYLAIPADNYMKGGFQFHKVCAIEEGFVAPDTQLKVLQDLNLLDQWRD